METEEKPTNTPACDAENAVEEPEVGGRHSRSRVAICTYCGSRNEVPDGQEFFTCWNCGDFVCRYN